MGGIVPTALGQIKGDRTKLTKIANMPLGRGGLLGKVLLDPMARGAQERLGKLPPVSSFGDTVTDRTPATTKVGGSPQRKRRGASSSTIKTLLGSSRVKTLSGR